ncbi:MAG: hypothetical protein NTX06_00445 [Proteobacteria bacterium]|nr:hypothetical protein [Pseudomonadota bacterium]
MNRRDFITYSTAAFFSALVADLASGRELKFSYNLFDGASEITAKGSVRPWPAVTAAVDVLVPADPDIADDFKGSDYGADRVVAENLGFAGQAFLTVMLNGYARAVAGKKFTACTPQEQLDAIKQWVGEREEQRPLLKDLLTGLLSLSMIGTFEDNTPAEQATIFASMGWYDPDDPAGTFRLPNEGYVDSYIFPVHLKKGVRK